MVSRLPLICFVRGAVSNDCTHRSLGAAGSSIPLMAVFVSVAGFLGEEQCPDQGHRGAGERKAVQRSPADPGGSHCH